MSDKEISKLFGVSKEEIKRQLELSKNIILKDRPLSNKNPLDVVLEGGREILEDQETLKLVRKIYQGK